MNAVDDLVAPGTGTRPADRAPRRPLSAPATLLVNLKLGCPNTALLKVAADLAELFDAGVLGVAAGRFMTAIYDDGCTSGEMVQAEQDAVTADIKAAENEFRGALQKRLGTLDWRSTIAFGLPVDYIVRQARGADILLTGAADGHTPGDIAMEAGRPVLVVPPNAGGLKLGHVIVAWQETREARLAVAGALPLLAQASRVSVVEVAPRAALAHAKSRVDDLVQWLRRHGVAAEPLVSCSDDGDASAFAAIAREQRADLVVAGAYGHSRLHEWVLGGFTRSLLQNTERCSLVAH